MESTWLNLYCTNNNNNDNNVKIHNYNNNKNHSNNSNNNNIIKINHLNVYNNSKNNNKNKNEIDHSWNVLDWIFIFKYINIHMWSLIYICIYVFVYMGNSGPYQEKDRLSCILYSNALIQINVYLFLYIYTYVDMNI
jgi:hypothetical protein